MSFRRDDAGDGPAPDRNPGEAAWRDAGHPEADHFDEVEAMRRFPSEADWLQLPMPTRAELIGEPALGAGPGDSALGAGPGDSALGSGEGDFVERTLRLVQDDSRLDRQLAELDRSLPRALLQSLTAPDPTANFVADTLLAVREDRSARWQHLLARYVAPEPSPQFVDRTLRALSSDRDPATDPLGDPRLGGQRSNHGRPGHDQAQRSRRTRGLVWWPWLGIAAAAVLWLVLSQNRVATLELRLSRAVPVAFAHATSASPLPAVFATLSRTRDAGTFAGNSLGGNSFGGDSFGGDSADGLWLLMAGN